MISHAVKTDPATVEVFRTNISGAAAADHALSMLRRLYPHCRITIDLEDCDRVLRIEGIGVSDTQVMMILMLEGIFVEPLPD